MGALILMAAIIAMTGCGGGSSSDSSELGGSNSFLTSGGNNKIAIFGQEADVEEREAASSALRENLQAREDGDWAKQCSTLTNGAIKGLEETTAPQRVKEGCKEELKFLAEPFTETKSIRANTMTGPIDALRVQGVKGFALYHGAQGKDYAMPMEKVDGEWKVDALITQTL